ncbi:eCIS core domain-containing protein [Streptomyces hirsutus]|uniref:eCIS core domain-containing protein n=1 Tax=Streptomyces hirsutus TaxID=35620 RepID=UPI00362D474D
MRTSEAHAERHENRQATRGPAAARQETSGSPAVPPPLTAYVLRAAQRGAGNAAVTAMIARRARPAPAVEQPDPGVHEVLRSAGKPLAAPVRRDMESRFRTDFSDVRLHTGAAAARSAQSIGARAYTSGSHVVIGGGGGDKHTLAHELTHVVQQRQGPVSGTDHGTGLRISDPSDHFERAAEANARRVLSGPAPVQREAGSAHSTGHSHVGAVQRMVTDVTEEATTAEQAPVVPADGRPQPQQISDAKRVGLEIEITVRLEEVSPKGQGSSSKSKGKAVTTLKNGDVLAESQAKELGLPVIKLEVEGMDRGVPSIELIYGPLPRDEYMQASHQKAREQLLAQFKKVAGKSVALEEVIDGYNKALGNDSGSYELEMTGTGRKVKTLQTKGINQNIQTNISLPYAKVGAAPPPAEAPANRGRGGGRGGAPAGRGRGASPAAGRGRGRGGGATASTGQPAGGVRGDFAGLFHDKSQKQLFEAARTAANGIADERVKGHPNVVSLLTQVLFQEAMYALHRIKKGEERDVDKQRFHVMLKVSPQDVAMTVLSDDEAAGLLAWLQEGGTLDALNRGATQAAEKGGAMVTKGVKVDLAGLVKALNTRLAAGRQQLGVRKKNTENDHSSPVLDAEGASTSELRHFHPRASNRVPVTVENDVHHVVVEERSAGHLLNDPDVSAAEKHRFIRDLQEE